MSCLAEFLKNFITYDLLRTLFVEFFKACITLLFAYISFRFFQNYKEKSQNNKIHIKILQLDADLRVNIEKIQDVLGLYEEGRILYDSLKIEGSNESYYNIAAKIDEIKNLYYIDKSYIDFNGDLVDDCSFERYPIEYIAEITNEIEYIKNIGNNLDKLEIEEGNLNYYKKKDVFDDLNELSKLITKVGKEKKLEKFNLELKEFNNIDIGTKINRLNDFCNKNFLQNEEVKGIIEKYKRYNFLVDKLLKNEKKENLVISFNKFNDNDGILAQYNAVFYFKIEEMLDIYNDKAILLNERGILEDTCKELIKYKDEIDVEKESIKKKIDSTKRFFGN